MPPQSDPLYPGMDGFLQTRGSLMLDLVFLAMFAVVPLLVWSVMLARRGKFRWHKRIQLTLAFVLLVAVTAFELEMRMVGWTERATPSRYWYGSDWNDPVHMSLAIHLFFAIPTTFLWLGVIVAAWRRFPNPPQPAPHSPTHRIWGRIAGIEMVMTAITGWVFYWLAFVL